jgi:hypothetical protein
VLILNGFAVDAETAVVVEMQSPGVQGQNWFWGWRGGRRRVVGLSGRGGLGKWRVVKWRVTSLKNQIPQS